MDKLKIHLRDENIIAIAGHVQKLSKLEKEKNSKRNQRIYDTNRRSMMNDINNNGNFEEAGFDGDDIQ